MATRPRRRVLTSPSKSAGISSTADGHSRREHKRQLSPDSDEVRQSAAVLEMLASNSHHRSTDGDDDNIGAATIGHISRPYYAQSTFWTLEKLLKASKPALLENFTETEELRTKSTFKCRLLPSECDFTIETRGSETLAKRRMQAHLDEHIADFKSRAEEHRSSFEFYPITRKDSVAAKTTRSAVSTSPAVSPIKKKGKRGRPPNSSYIDGTAPRSASTKRRKKSDLPTDTSPVKRSRRLSVKKTQADGSYTGRVGRRPRISVEVTVATSEDEHAHDAERRDSGDWQKSKRNWQNDTEFDTNSALFAGVSPSSANAVAQAPKYYEMTPYLLESLMAPIGLYQSPSEDGDEKELRLRIPVDYGAGCSGVCDVLFNEHLGVRIDGTTDWMPVRFIGDYLDSESVEMKESGTLMVSNKLPRSTASGSSTQCNEDFGRIAAVLEMNEWMEQVVRRSSGTPLMKEHDYAEPAMKFGRPRSCSLLQDAVAAFNKYVNFIRLSERREPFLFGLWWEKEDAHTDYWLLPKTLDDTEGDKQDNMLLIPVANEWTEEVVVASEEAILLNGASSVSTPMTFWDNRGFLRPTDGSDWAFSKTSFNPSSSKLGGERGMKPGDMRRRTTTTPVARAPRFLAPKLEPGSARFGGMADENGFPSNMDELMDYQRDGNSETQRSTASCSNYSRSSSQAVTATGTRMKNMSMEKLNEIDFAMRCIKELQQRRYRGSYPLRCRICNREFTAPTSLIVHYRSHAGIKPFTCPICLTSFTRRHSLKYHMLCHSGQARFKCNTCDRLFRHSGHFRDHMRKHEHGMPFNCADCGRFFATRTTFRRHMAVVHNSATPIKGKGRSVGVSKLAGDLGETGELGEVAEEIEYEDDDDEDVDVAEEIEYEDDDEEDVDGCGIRVPKSFF